MKLQAQKSLHHHIMGWLLFCLAGLLLTAGIASAQNADSTVRGITIDEQATAQAPWKAGEMVPYSDKRANLNRLGVYDVYRVFLGVTPQGYYVIQDFYADNSAKLTDPYVVKNERDVEPTRSYNTEYITVEGPYVRWYPGGQKYQEGQMVDGKEEGEWRLWHPNGQPASISFYVSGKRNGWEDEWSESGVMTKHCHFKDDLLDGVCTMWYENGAKQSERTHRQGASISLENWWHENGQLKTQGSRNDNGELQGEWRNWDRNGNLTRQSWYENGQLIRREEYSVPTQQ